jgi:anticodon-binding protein
LDFASDIKTRFLYLFKDPVEYSMAMMPSNYPSVMDKLLHLVHATNSYNELFVALDEHAENANEVLRFALTGCRIGVGLKELYELLGKERVMTRVHNSIQCLRGSVVKAHI